MSVDSSVGGYWRVLVETGEFEKAVLGRPGRRLRKEKPAGSAFGLKQDIEIDGFYLVHSPDI
jgi:hypothetical protein